MRLANGRLGNDIVGDFTCISSLGTSVIDYLLLNKQDFHMIDQFTVDSPNEYSDHCPLSFTLLCNHARDSSGECVEHRRVKWCDSGKHEFRRGIISKLTDMNSIVRSIDIHDHHSIIRQWKILHRF